MDVTLTSFAMFTINERIIMAISNVSFLNPVWWSISAKSLAQPDAKQHAIHVLMKDVICLGFCKTLSPNLSQIEAIMLTNGIRYLRSEIIPSISDISLPKSLIKKCLYIEVYR